MLKRKRDVVSGDEKNSTRLRLTASTLSIRNFTWFIFQYYTSPSFFYYHSSVNCKLRVCRRCILRDRFAIKIFMYMPSKEDSRFIDTLIYLLPRNGAHAWRVLKFKVRRLKNLARFSRPSLLFFFFRGKNWFGKNLRLIGRSQVARFFLFYRSIKIVVEREMRGIVLQNRAWVAGRPLGFEHPGWWDFRETARSRTDQLYFESVRKIRFDIPRVRERSIKDSLRLSYVYFFSSDKGRIECECRMELNFVFTGVEIQFLEKITEEKRLHRSLGENSLTYRR